MPVITRARVKFCNVEFHETRIQAPKISDLADKKTLDHSILTQHWQSSYLSLHEWGRPREGNAGGLELYEMTCFYVA
jgi:hypothetical protein